MGRDSYLGAYPDAWYGDRAVLRSASGRSVDVTCIDIARVVDGKIVEHWGVPDRFALLSQTGVLERLTPAAAVGGTR